MYFLTLLKLADQHMMIAIFTCTCRLVKYTKSLSSTMIDRNFLIDKFEAYVNGDIHRVGKLETENYEVIYFLLLQLHRTTHNFFYMTFDA